MGSISFQHFPPLELVNGLDLDLVNFLSEDSPQILDGVQVGAVGRPGGQDFDVVVRDPSARRESGRCAVWHHCLPVSRQLVFQVHQQRVGPADPGEVSAVVAAEVSLEQEPWNKPASCPPPKHRNCDFSKM